MMKRIVLAGMMFFLACAPLSVFAQTDEESLQALEQLQETISDFQEQIQTTSEAMAQPEVSSEEIKVRIVRIVSEYEKDGREQKVFEVDNGGEIIRIDTGESFTEGLRYRLQEGQMVYVQLIYKDGAVDAAFLVDIVRTHTLLFLFLIFCVLVTLVGYWRGLQAIIGLGLTLGVLFGFIIPQILAGASAVLVTVLGSVVILAINMHLSHGVSRQTCVAFLSTCCGLLLSVGFGAFFVWIANLSGLSSEENVLLYFQSGTILVPTGILLAGIILGAVGVLDDIAITQSETVAELIDANPKLTRKELYMRAMRVGRHHIASTVNTLVLAYAGVALPLFLLFVMIKDVSPLRFINEELVAEEIVRTLAGTSALILTVPIATLFATWVQKAKGASHSHKH